MACTVHALHVKRHGTYPPWRHVRNVIVWGACALWDLIGYFSDSIGWLSRDLVIVQVV